MVVTTDEGSSQLAERDRHRATEAPRRDFVDRARLFLNEYAWFIVRNIVGWMLILAAPPLGLLLPGPGGLPVFLIGFALVTFPGKRRLTARVLRGIGGLRIEDAAYAFAARCSSPS